MTGLPQVEGLVGQVVELNEDDYTFGIGLLRLRIVRATPLRADPSWVMVDGVKVDFRGGEHETRTVMVRLTAVRALLPTRSSDDD